MIAVISPASVRADTIALASPNARPNYPHCSNSMPRSDLPGQSDSSKLGSSQEVHNMITPASVRADTSALANPNALPNDPRLSNSMPRSDQPGQSDSSKLGSSQEVHNTITTPPTAAETNGQSFRRVGGASILASGSEL